MLLLLTNFVKYQESKLTFKTKQNNKDKVISGHFSSLDPHRAGSLLL